jgi:two-component system response regulator FixJ
MPDSTVFIVDDDDALRDSLRALLESADLRVEDFNSAAKFLDIYTPARGGCLVADVRMPDMDGLALLAELAKRQASVPVIVMTGHGDIPLAVRAMRAGAADFIEKPFDDERMLASIRQALDLGRQARGQSSAAQAAQERIAGLTPRERDVLELLVAGHPNKVVAFKLDISPRTVEVHRGRLMEKMQAKSLSDLVRTALSAGISQPE